MYHIVNEKASISILYDMLGLRFSVIQFFRITENTKFILKFVDLKHERGTFAETNKRSKFILSAVTSESE